MNNKIKKIIVGVVAIILVAAMAVIYTQFGEKPQEGSKNITITVVDSALEETVYDVSTDAEYLKQAMNEADGLEYIGNEGPYGLMITEVNGEVADYNTNGAYWSFYVNEEYCNYGIDEQPVADGDAFKIVYTKS